MSNIIAQTIEQISKEKNVDPKIIISALEDAMVAASRKFYKTNEDINARFDPETGMVEIFAVRRVVETVENPSLEISLADAKEIDNTLEIDDTVEIPKPTDVLGRIAAQTAKQVILQKVREAERQNIYNEYSQKIGEMVNGVAKRFEGPDIIVDIGKTEALLPLREQSRAETYKQGERIRAVIVKVLPVAKGPQVILSRTDPQLLVRLFEMEIPEIYDGTIVVKSAVHEPGDRAKVAVASLDRDVDPVGACVGMKGSRINSIIRELRGEKIDIVQWSDDPAQYAANALNPAKISKVLIIDLRREANGGNRRGEAAIAGNREERPECAPRLKTHRVANRRQERGAEKTGSSQRHGVFDIFLYLPFRIGRHQCPHHRAVARVRD